MKTPRKRAREVVSNPSWVNRGCMYDRSNKLFPVETTDKSILENLIAEAIEKAMKDGIRIGIDLLQNELGRLEADE